VSRLLSDPARLASIGARSRARVVPAMRWEAIARRYLEIYRGLLGEAG
jgi:glycosyltransferase involved in cell wall biosynthesis